MFATLVEIISWILIVSGGAFSVIGAIGQFRFPDFWARLHAASVSDSAGMILLIAGMILQSGVSLISAKLIIIGAFLYITGATSTHAVASAALVSGLKPPVLKRTKSGRKSRSKKEQAKT